jgi:hypothetical protein
MRAVICFAARGIVRDAESGTISAYSILEDLRPAGFPAVLPEAAVFVLWKREAHEPAAVDLQFQLVNNDTALAGSPWHIDFANGLTNRTVVNLQGVVLSNPGTLSFNFLRDDAVIASYTVTVAAPPARVAEHQAPQ